MKKEKKYTFQAIESKREANIMDDEIDIKRHILTVNQNNLKNTFSDDLRLAYFNEDDKGDKEKKLIANMTKQSHEVLNYYRELATRVQKGSKTYYDILSVGKYLSDSLTLHASLLINFNINKKENPLLAEVLGVMKPTEQAPTFDEKILDKLEGKKE